MLAPGTLSVSFTFNLGLDNINGLQSFLRGLPPTVWSGWRLNSPQPSSGKSAHYIQLLRGALLELIPHHWNLEVFSFSPLVLSWWDVISFIPHGEVFLLILKIQKKKENHLAVFFFLIQESQQTLTSVESHRHFHMEFTLPLSERKNAEAEGGVGMRARNWCQHELWGSGLQMCSLWVSCSPWRRAAARACLCC